MDDREYALKISELSLRSRELDIRERELTLAESALDFQVRQHRDRLAELDEARASLDTLRDMAAGTTHPDCDRDDDPHPVFSRGSRGRA